MSLVERGHIVLVYFVCLVAFQGIWQTDYPDFATIAQNPFVVMAHKSRQYLYSSPVNFIIAYVLQMPNALGFYLIHGAFLAALPFVIKGSIERKQMDLERKAHFISLLFLSPVFLVCIKYFGKTDTILVACTFLIWSTEQRVVRTLAGVAMILAHQEMGSIMLVALYLTEKKRDHTLLIPLLVGNGLHVLYKRALLDAVPVGRAEFAAAHLQKFLNFLKLGYPVLLLGALTWYWVPLLLWPPGWLAGVLLVGSFFVAVVTLDFTRTFALITLPVVLTHAADTSRMLAALRAPPSRVLFACFVLGMLQFEVAVNGSVRASGVVGAIKHYLQGPLR